MSENKGILDKIKDFFNKILKKDKEVKKLPASSVGEEQSDEFKKKVANLDNYNNEEQNYEAILDAIDTITLPVDLNGYSFKTDVSINNYVDIEMESYVCYLNKDEEENLEKALLICTNFSKENAQKVENTLNELKNRKNNTLIEDIQNLGFKDENGKRFMPTEDYHLDYLLEQLLQAEAKGAEKITIPQNYTYQETTYGMEIVKTNRQLRKEREKNTPDYENIIKNSVIKKEKLDLSNMNNEQIKNLKHYYIKLISDIESKMDSDEYLNLGVACISKLSNELKYHELLNDYSKIQYDLKKWKNDNIKKVDVQRRLSTCRRLILQHLIGELKENLNIIKQRINEHEI